MAIIPNRYCQQTMMNGVRMKSKCKINCVRFDAFFVVDHLKVIGAGGFFSFVN